MKMICFFFNATGEGGSCISDDADEDEETGGVRRSNSE